MTTVLKTNNMPPQIAKTSHLSFRDGRYKHYERDISNSDRLKAGFGSVIGTSISLALMMKKQKIKNPLKLKYGIWEMIGMAGASILGGVGLGLVGEKKEVQKDRLKEGLFQLMNVAIPAWIVNGAVGMCEHNPKYNNKFCKILSIAGGLLIGMYGAADLSNIIVDPLDKQPDRKLTFKDALINLDDAIGALVLAKIPLVDKLNLQGILPTIYAFCGYRAGSGN